MKTSIVFTFLIASLLLPYLGYTQQWRPPVDPVEEEESEKPDDPYLPNAYNNQKLSPAYSYDSRSDSRSGNTEIFTRQVNVTQNQHNIVGDAGNETNIAVNPLNEDEIVIGWRQFDNVNSNFRQAGWAYSPNGGKTGSSAVPLIPAVLILIPSSITTTLVIFITTG